MPQQKQGGITVDSAREISVPETAAHAMERSSRVEKEVHAGRVARSEALTAKKADQPSTNELPANRGLKTANHVHDVFKKR
jgi:hypothetical protein